MEAVVCLNGGRGGSPSSLGLPTYVPGRCDTKAALPFLLQGVVWKESFHIGVRRQQCRSPERTLTCLPVSDGMNYLRGLCLMSV